MAKSEGEILLGELNESAKEVLNDAYDKYIIRGKEMRDLKQQEIDDAPQWATHYYVSRINDTVRWNGDELFMWEFESAAKSISEYGFRNMHTQPIPRKPFDISEHEFSDETSHIEINSANELAVCMTATNGKWFAMYKDDAIALAKHFKLTVEDLK